MASARPTEPCPDCRRRERELEDARRAIAKLQMTLRDLHHQMNVARDQQLELSRREVRLRELALEEERRRTQLTWRESSSGAAFRAWCAQLSELDRYCAERSRAWVTAWLNSARERVGQVPSLEEVRGGAAPQLRFRQSRLTRADRKRLDEAVDHYNQQLRQSLGPGRVQLSRTRPGLKVSEELDLYLRVEIPWTPDALDDSLRQSRALAGEGPARLVRAQDLPPLAYPRVTEQSATFPRHVRGWYDGVRSGPVTRVR